MATKTGMTAQKNKPVIVYSISHMAILAVAMKIVGKLFTLAVKCVIVHLTFR